MQLTVQHFMWLLRAGVLTYARSLDHPGSIYVVRGGPSAIEVRPVFMPAPMFGRNNGRLGEIITTERWEDIRRLRVAQALDRIAKAGALNAHTTLWLHARVGEIIDRATPQSV